MKPVVALAAMAAVLTVAVVVNSRLNSSAQPAAQLVPAPATMVVTAEPVRSRVLAYTATIVGQCVTDKSATIAAQYPGSVLSVYAVPGQYVSQGAVLALVDGRREAAQARSAEAVADSAVLGVAKSRVAAQVQVNQARLADVQAGAAVAAARTHLLQARSAAVLSAAGSAADVETSAQAIRQAEAAVNEIEVRAADANSAAKRAAVLYAHGGIARVDLDTSRSLVVELSEQHKSALAGLESARISNTHLRANAPVRAQVAAQDVSAAAASLTQALNVQKAAHASLETSRRLSQVDTRLAQSDVRRTRAELELGSVAVKNGRPTAPFSGQIQNVLVHVGDTVQPGQPLLTLVDRGSAYGLFSVPGPVAAQIQPGMPVAVCAADQPGHVYPAQVARLLPDTGLDGRTRLLRVNFTKGSGWPTPGISLTGTVALSSKAGSPAVSAAALRSDAVGRYVYVVRSGRAWRQNLVTGHASGNYLQVTSGLSVGDVVITSGDLLLQDGATVNVQIKR